MASERRMTIHPADWWAAWEVEATKEGLDLATWMGKQCNKSLRKEVRDKLSQRQTRGRPKTKSSTDNESNS